MTQRGHRGASPMKEMARVKLAGFGVALLELMNRALRQTDMRTELALAPAENSARRSDFRGKAEPLHPDQLEKLR